MKKILAEFKAFAMKGNIVDLAVAVILGGAFGKIVSSLVNDVLMPLIGIILGGLDFSGLKATVGNASIQYGLFIQAIVNFIIIALSIFFIVKALNKTKKPVKEEKAKKVVTDVELLTEIRDLLKKKK